MSKVLWSGLMLAMVLGISGVSEAQHHHHHPHRHCRYRHHHRICRYEQPTTE